VVKGFFWRVIVPLITFKEMMEDAGRKGYAVGYFESWNLNSLEAVLEAAEETNSPVIIGFGCSVVSQEWLDRRGLDYLAVLGRAAARKSLVPVCYILNEIQTLEQMERGVRLGFNVVMMDTSGLEFKKNISVTRRAVRTAHAYGTAVEGELGKLPTAGSKEDSSAELTDPGQAEEFVRRTGVDALSVSIGNVHLLTEGKAQVYIERLKKIHEAVKVPFVIHGGTGFPDEAIPDAIRFGVRKFNVGTVMKKAYIDEIIKRTSGMEIDKLDIQAVVGSRKDEDVFTKAKNRVKDVVKGLIKKYGSAGQA